MRSVTVVILFFFARRACSEALGSYEITEITRASDELVGKVVYRLVDGLFAYSLKSLPRYNANLVGMMLTGFGNHAFEPRATRGRPFVPICARSAFTRGLHQRGAMLSRFKKAFMPRAASVRTYSFSPEAYIGPFPERPVTTYGEIAPGGFSVFKRFYRNSTTNHFLDLGSGEGNSLLYFFASFPETQSITGIEYLQARHDAAVAKMQVAFRDAPESTSRSEYHYGPFHLYCGNFLDTQFQQIIKKASLVYVANLLFSKTTNRNIKARLSENKGAVVISCKELSVSSTRTTLNQTWMQDGGQGYIWRVGNAIN